MMMMAILLFVLPQVQCKIETPNARYLLSETIPLNGSYYFLEGEDIVAAPAIQLTASWLATNGPLGSDAVIVDNHKLKASMSVTKAGIYEIKLVVARPPYLGLCSIKIAVEPANRAD